ncbi:MAG TPA: iron-containing alcohol dehydrogenase [Casimicrobiaceae bacterium]|nr:iron-containing alcohol dehydrogenase [Casimicrobiaceae bacterium]
MNGVVTMMDNASQPFSFVHSNRRVISAWGGLDKLGELAKEHGSRRPAVVMDAFFAGGERSARIESLLSEACGQRPHFHFVPAHEPDIETVNACAQAMAAANPDLVVAVGGGSAMDTAKIARLLLSNPGPVEAIAGFGKRFKPHESLMIAVPTTAGTGSEVSESAIAGKPNSDLKLIFRSQDMTPQIALLDASLCVSAPTSVIAASGFDAVTHAVEAYVAKAASVMTDPFAESALRLLGRWLPIAYRDPANGEAMSACLIASCQAAIAFNSANLGLAHALAAPLGALHHVAHGLGNALALPTVTAYNETAMGAKARFIADAFGAQSAAAGVAKMRAALDLDVSLDEFVVTDEERERLAQSAMKSGQVRMNPRLATIDDMRAIVQCMRTPTGSEAPRIEI